MNVAPTFNGVGTGKVLTPVGATADVANSVTFQADGKILVAGYGLGSDVTYDFAVVRYNSDGGLDTGFGTGGKLLTPVGAGVSHGYGRSVTVQADGKIVVAGYGEGSVTGGDFAVVRYNSDGSLDTGFGAGGKVLTPVGADASIDEAFSVSMQTDGKIVVAGYGRGSGNGSAYDFAVVRYDADGSLDTGFGAGGKVLTPVGSATSNEFGQSVTVQADGKILVAGYGQGSGGYDFAMVRFNANGSLDTGFGTGGKVLTPVGAGTTGDIGRSVAVQADGKIVVAGNTEVRGVGVAGGNDFAVVRYNADGSLDTGFGAGGKTLTPVGPASSNDFGQSVTVQADGKILVAGTGEDRDGTLNFAMVRYNANGSLDTGFGAGGKVLTLVGDASAGSSVTVLADGKIVVAGASYDDDGSDFALVRYNANGTLDATFNAPSTLGGTVAFTEDGAAVRLDADVDISDINLDGLNGGAGDYSRATLTLARAGGANAHDAFGFSPTGFTVSGASLLDANGVAFATFTSTGGQLVVTFTGSGVATSALADLVARAVTYANGSDAPPASVSIKWTFNDGGGSAQGSGGPQTTTGVSTVTIATVNDTPALTGAQATLVNGMEDTAYTGAISDLLTGFTDVDSATLSVTGLSADHGTVAIRGSTFTLTPEANYAGPVTLSYSVSDGAASTLATRTVTIAAVNDEPVLSFPRLPLISEGVAQGAVIGVIGVTDRDVGDNVTLAISDDESGLFEIQDGVLKLKNGASLDFETAKTHSITIEATDSHGLKDTLTVRLKVANANEAPKDITVSKTTVDEDIGAGRLIAKVKALDPDAKDKVVITIVDGADTPFQIKNGALVLKAGTHLDFEAKANWDLTLRATDKAGLTYDEHVRIDVNDVNERPTDILVTGGSVSESAKAGTVIATLKGLDPDAGERFTYSVNSSILEVRGNKLVLKSAGQLNHERSAEETFRVSAYDHDGLRLIKDVTIKVTDDVDVKGTMKADKLSGGNYADEILGLKGNDTIAGGGGNDTIVGGQGVDRLTGSSGADIFRFNATSEYGDVITDFRSGEDHFQFARKTLGGVSESAIDLFVDKAPDGGPALLFSSKTHVLSFDEDGSGALKATPLMILEGVKTLTLDDFQII